MSKRTAVDAQLMRIFENLSLEPSIANGISGLQKSLVAIEHISLTIQ
jgi:hypothetical protein